MVKAMDPVDAFTEMAKEAPVVRVFLNDIYIPTITSYQKKFKKFGLVLVAMKIEDAESLEKIDHLEI